MECTSEYTNWDLKSDAEFTAWRVSQGPHSLACVKYPYCSHYGGAFYNPIPPWIRREEARHSDIPKGMARALEDGHPLMDHPDLWRFTFYIRRDQDWIRARLARLRSLWTPRSTTQERLSFLD